MALVALGCGLPEHRCASEHNYRDQRLIGDESRQPQGRGYAADARPDHREPHEPDPPLCPPPPTVRGESRENHIPVGGPEERQCQGQSDLQHEHATVGRRPEGGRGGHLGPDVVGAGRDDGDQTVSRQSRKSPCDRAEQRRGQRRSIHKDPQRESQEPTGPRSGGDGMAPVDEDRERTISPVRRMPGEACGQRDSQGQQQARGPR